MVRSLADRTFQLRSDKMVGFQDEQQVYAGTCVVLILLIFFVVVGSWYFIPWDKEYFGIQSGNVKIALLLLSWAGCGAVMMMAVEGYKPKLLMSSDSFSEIMK